MNYLKDKVAIVTGANSGIGKETAIRFAEEGANLVLCARRLNLLEEVAESCRALGVEAIAVQADLTSHEQCLNVVNAAIEKFGKIDVLVNNAGIADKHIPITECSDDWWEHVVDIDQTSLFYMMKETIPYMEKQGSGSIVNVSSIGGVFGSAGIAYSAAKSAVLGMTKNVAIQLAPKGIRCNAVCPGPTPTPLCSPEQVKTFNVWFGDMCRLHMNQTLPKSTAREQANAILLFAGDDSTAITGQVLVVDHGRTL